MKTVDHSLLLQAILVISVVGCGDGITDPETAIPVPESYLLVANASVDFQTATFGWIDTETLTAVPDLAALQPDSAVRWTNGHLFAINRLGADNVQRLDPSTLLTVWQYSTGPGSNPQDIAVVSANKGYVTLYARNSILIVDPQAASEADFITGQVDLVGLADADGVAEASSLALFQDRLYVAVQRVDRNDGFRANNVSYLAAIDTATDELVDISPDKEGDVLELPFRNPTTMTVIGDELWIVCVGYFNEQDGALLAIDLQTHSTRVILEEQDVGGDISAFAGSDPIFLLWTDTDFEGNLSAFDPESDELTLLETNLGFIDDIAADEDLVYVPDRSLSEPGVRVFSIDDGGEVTETPIRTGLPPWRLEVVER